MEQSLPESLRIEEKPGKHRVFAIANQKGGVGKTTTTINLATGLAAVNRRVLIIDLDPQGNASTGLGIERGDRSISSYQVVTGATPLRQAIRHSRIPNLDIVPATVDLLGAELELIGVDRRSFRIRDALEAAATDYDYILIDCPPALGLLTLNALTAADAILVPLQCEFFALEGLSQLLRTVELVKRSFNPKLELQGVVLTMFDKRNNLSEQVAQDARGHLGNKVFETIIPRNVRISEAPSHGKPALIYDHTCSGSRAYMDLAREFLRREETPAVAA
jgi:chromosome partitioning protein